MDQYLQRQIELQRKKIQVQRAAENSNKQKQIAEFELEFYSLKKVLESDNPVNEIYYLSAEIYPENPFYMLVQLDKRDIVQKVEEYTYRGQKAQRVVPGEFDESQDILMRFSFVWLPDKKIWAMVLNQKTNGSSVIDEMGPTDFLLNKFLEAAAEIIAKDIENAYEN